jgi:general secretion pathway protein L
MAENNSALQWSSATLADFARRTGLVGFWRWWSAELTPLVPTRAREAVQRRRLRPVLAFDGDEAVLYRPAAQQHASGLVESARIPLTGDANAVAATGRAAIAQLAYGTTTGEPRVVIALPAKQVLRRTLTLPSAVEENLRRTVGYDLDRLTPFKPDELYFDVVVVDRDAAKGELRVDIASVRRTIVDQAVALAVGWGASVAAVVPVAPEAAALSRLNLLPEHARPSRSVWSRWQFWLPLALLALFAASAVILPLWQKRDYAIGVMKQAEQARVQALQSERLRNELDRQAGDYNFALGRKYAFPGTAQVLDEMSRLLPDDTWLTQLDIKNVARGKDPARELTMRGESQNAGKLISILEDSKLVGQAAPRSPTTKIQQGTGEVFDLAAQLKTLPAPALVSLTASGAAPVAAVASPPPVAPSEPAPAAAPVAKSAPAAPASGAPPPVAATPSPMPVTSPMAAPGSPPIPGMAADRSKEAN